MLAALDRYIVVATNLSTGPGANRAGLRRSRNAIRTTKHTAKYGHRQRTITRRRKLCVSAHAVLHHWHLQAALPKFLSTADGLAILTLLANAAAKEAYPDHAAMQEWYRHKQALLDATVEVAPFCWQRRDRYGEQGKSLVIIETVVGQMAFHSTSESRYSWLPRANGRRWNGLSLGQHARLAALTYLDEEEHGVAFDLTLRRCTRRRHPNPTC